MLVAYLPLDLIRSLRPVVQQLATYTGEEGELVDAANSITRNIAEGSGRSAKDMRRFYW